MIYLNNVNARNKLFSKGKVYVLRAKSSIGKEGQTKGETDLYWDVAVNRGKRIKFTYLHKIKNDDDLREYLSLSGYLSVEEWRKDAGRNKHLFMLKMVDFIKTVKM